MAEVQQSMRSGVLWSFFSTITGASTQLFFLYLVAKTSGPAVVASYSVLAAIQSIAYLLQDGGLMTYFIHRQDLESRKQSGLFWLAVVIGLIIAGALTLISPVVISFYGVDELLFPLILISFQVAVLGFSSQSQALLMKRLQLVKLAKIEIIGKIVAPLVAVLLLAQGATTMAVLDVVFVSIVAASLVRSLLLLFTGFEVIKNAFSFRPDWSVVAPAARYTIYHLGAQITNQIRANLDVFVLMRIVGAELTGVYALAKDLVLKPSRIIQPVVARVVMPLLARQQGRGKESTQLGLYLRSLNYCSVANAVVFSLLALLGPLIIDYFLDEAYNGSKALISILCVWGYCRSLGAPSASLAYANGRTEIDFWWNSATLPLTLMVVLVGALLPIVFLPWILSSLQILMTFMVFFVFTKKLIISSKLDAYLMQWVPGLLVVSMFSVFSFLIYNV